MGRQKKNELDAILEQLKKSYATDIDNELEDSLLNAEETEEDAELASVLEKIFASSSDETDDMDEDTESHLEKAIEEDTTDDTGEITAQTYNDTSNGIEIESEEVETEEVVAIDEYSEMPTDPDAIVTPAQKVENTAEEEKVDDVLKMMFHQSTESDVDNISDTSDDADLANNGADIEDHSSLLDILIQEDPYEEDVHEFNADNIEVIDNVDECSYYDESSEDIHGFETEPEFVIGYNEYDNASSETPDGEHLDDRYEQAVGFDEYEDENTEIEADNIDTKTIILDPQYYTSDILQHPLSDMSLFKPQDDIDFSVYAQTESNEEEQEASVEETASAASTVEVNDNDISLLMKFGYSDEIASSVGNEYAQTVVVDKNNEYAPKKHRIAHGFIGKEFSEKDQIKDITKKFKSDKRQLLVISIIISVIAAAMLTGDVLALLSNSVNDYLSLILFESLFVLITIILLGKRLYAGILGIIRFEANAYSMLSVVLLEYLIYCSAIVIMYNISPTLVYSQVYIALGGYVSLYAALTVWAEYVDCCREYNTFNIISRGSVHCVLEKKIGESTGLYEKKTKHTELSYSIKRSQFVSGFFRRIIDRGVSNVNILLIVGVVPFVAILVGIATAMLRDNVVLGVNAAGYVLFAAVPLSSVFVPSLIEFINSVKLGRKHSAFIGIEAVDEYAKVDSLSFCDCDAIEITALTEIDPNKNDDSPRKWLNIAGNVFEALGGPLSKVVKGRPVGESNVGHDATINSISENGIDLYFDSSMNILIGDRQYMLAHNIKVKTDANLSTAVKGVDRTVIYMAFDGIPQIGFIVTSKIKQSFLETVELLEKNKIKIVVNSYEPEINDYYFESNKVENLLSVHKPSNYEHSEPSTILDSGIISSTPYDLCSTVMYGQKIINDRKGAKKTRIIQTIVGLVVAGLLIAVTCLAPNNQAIATIQSNTLLIFYLAAVLGWIPNIVQIVKLIRRK